MAADSPPTCLAQLLSCSVGQGEALAPDPASSSTVNEGPPLIPSSTPVCQTHPYRPSPPMVCATYTLQHQLSLSHEHSSATHAICVSHSHSRVFLHTHRVSCPAIPTLSVCLTYTMLMSPSPIHTQDRSNASKNPYTPTCLKDSDTLSLSISPQWPRLSPPPSHTNSPSSLPHLSHTHGQSSPFPHTVCPARHVRLTRTVANPRPTSALNTHFFLRSGGSNRAASPKSPIFSSMFSVIKKFPGPGQRGASDSFLFASPPPPPPPHADPEVSPSLRSRCKMPRWCKYLSPERICRR